MAERDVVVAYQIIGIVLGFELITVEVNDFVRQYALHHAVTGEVVFLECMVLATLWVVYAYRSR